MSGRFAPREGLAPRERSAEERADEERAKQRAWKRLQTQYRTLFDVDPKAREREVRALLARRYVYEAELPLVRDLRRARERDAEAAARDALGEYERLLAHQRRARRRRAEAAALAEAAAPPGPAGYRDLGAEIAGAAALLRAGHARLGAAPRALSPVQRAALRWEAARPSRRPFAEKAADYLLGFGVDLVGVEGGPERPDAPPGRLDTLT